MTKKFHIMRSYMALDVFEIDAADEDDALKKYLAGGNHDFVKTYDDGPYDDAITVEAV